jgi:hypothetical protein
LEKNDFKLVPIKTGISSEGDTEILDAEKLQNKKIVAKRTYDLLMALKMKWNKTKCHSFRLGFFFLIQTKTHPGVIKFLFKISLFLINFYFYKLIFLI